MRIWPPDGHSAQANQRLNVYAHFLPKFFKKVVYWHILFRIFKEYKLNVVFSIACKHPSLNGHGRILTRAVDYAMLPIKRQKSWSMTSACESWPTCWGKIPGAACLSLCVGWSQNTSEISLWVQEWKILLIPTFD